MRRAGLIHRQLIPGIQIMLAEDIEICVQRRGCVAIARKIEAQTGHFGGTQVLTAGGSAQTVA